MNRRKSTHFLNRNQKSTHFWKSTQMAKGRNTKRHPDNSRWVGRMPFSVAEIYKVSLCSSGGHTLGSRSYSLISRSVGAPFSSARPSWVAARRILLFTWTPPILAGEKISKLSDISFPPLIVLTEESSDTSAHYLCSSKYHAGSSIPAPAGSCFHSAPRPFQMEFHVWCRMSKYRIEQKYEGCNLQIH